MNGASYFTRGFNTAIVREDLMSRDESRQISALTHTIALMAIGKDVSPLFTEVSSLASSSNMTLKRLTHFFLQQYGRIQPEKSVLQAGSFVKDTLHQSPLVRGAGIRSMTSLQVPPVTEFVKAPLRRLLSDPDPYVRRNAVLGLLKSITVSHYLLNTGLLDKVIEMLKDDSPSVVAACIQTLQELSQRGIISGTGKEFHSVKGHLISLLDRASDWSAFYILEGLAETFSRDLQTNEPGVFLHENEDAIMRVLPFACYASSLLVMASAKVLSQFMLCCEEILPQRERWEIEERFGPCLVRALVSQLSTARYEVQYVVLRNIQLLLQTPLNRFFHSFFSAFRLLYDDLVYIKVEKIRCLVGLSNEEYGGRILEELFTHTISSNDAIAQESIRSIGAVAIAVDVLSTAAIQRLQNLIESNVPRVTEEAVVVLHQLLQVYPRQFPNVMQTLCNALLVIKAPHAIEAVVWALGRPELPVEQSLLYLQRFCENFSGNSQILQLATLTAVAKLSVREDQTKEQKVETGKVLGIILNQGVKAEDSIIRDRALYYLRLLTSHTVAARRTLFATDMRIRNNNAGISLEKALTLRMVRGMGTLVSVKQKPLNVLLNATAYCSGALEEEEEECFDEEGDDVDEMGSASTGGPEEKGNELPRKMVPEGFTSSTAAADDVGHPAWASSDNSEGKLRSSPRITGGTQYSTVVFPEEGSGVKVEMMWDQMVSRLVLKVRLSLEEGEDYVRKASVDELQINRNAFSIGVAQVIPPTLITPDSSAEINVITSSNNQFRSTVGVEVAISVQPLGILCFLAPPIPPQYLLLPPVHIEKALYTELRQEYKAPMWTLSVGSAWESTAVPCVASRLSANVFRMFSLFMVQHTEENSSSSYFLYGETISHEKLLYELTIHNDTVARCFVYTQQPTLAFFFGEYLIRLLRVVR